MVQGIIIVLVYLFFAYLMLRQKIPSFLALMAMSILIPLVAGAPLTGDDSVISVINVGSYGLASSIPALIFGAWVGEIMNQTGITRDIIRRASELAGDRPLIVALVMYFVVALLFTTLTGFGATIMVATLVFPIFSAVGIKPIVSACLLIMARTSGLVFNMSQWTLYMNASGLGVEPISQFAAIASVCGIIVSMAYLFYNLKLKKSTAWAMPIDSTTDMDAAKKVPLIALLTPLIPFPLVIGLKWPIIPALLVAAVFGALATNIKNPFPVLSKSIHEAIKSIAPALVLFISIGMVLSAMKNPMVSEKFLMLVGPIIPSTAIGFALFFIIGTPLALYRGLLNLWGMGAGVIGLIIAANTMPSIAVCAGFIAVQLVQLSSCPTNTHNVWSADYHGLEVNALTKNMMPFMWVGSAMAIIVGAMLYF